MDRWQRIEDLFAQALDMPAPARAAFLDTQCGDDAALRTEVESLVASAAGAGQRLRGAMVAGAEVVVDDLAQRHVGLLIGPWRVLDVLGEGGMGTVYLARRDDGQFRRDVALKVLQHGLFSQAIVARFRDERQILASLQHPDIVKLLDGGTTDEGLPYLVMELVDGVPLERFARRLPIRERVALLQRVCAPLQYAHQQLVVHRDIKPSNILVGPDGVPKLLDFGIAKLLEAAGTGREARTRTGIALLTPEYASPEQARGDVVSVASDVYALGAVLFHLLVGEPPQKGSDDALETLRRICELDPPRPSTVAPPADRKAIAGDLDNIVGRALQKSPALRYPSVAAFADDLERYLDGRPVKARDATLGYRAKKFVGRHRGALVLGALIVGALTAATIISIIQAERASEAAAEAQRQNRALLVEQARQALADGEAGRALPWLVEAWARGEDTPAVRFMVAEGQRPYRREIARIRDLPRGMSTVAWSPSGGIFACGNAGRVRLYDADARPTRTLDVGADTDFDGCIMDAAGTQLVAHVPDGRTFLWDVARGELRWRTATRPFERKSVWSGHGLGLSFGAGGRRVVTCGQGRPPEVLDAATGASVLALEWPRYAEHHCALSPDGARLFAAASGRVSERDGETGVIIRELAPALELASDPMLTDLDGPMARLYPLRDGRRLLITLGQRVWIWDVPEARVLAVLPGHAGGVWAMVPSDDERRVVTSTKDGGVYLWDLETGKRLGDLSGRGQLSVRDARYDPSGARVVTTSGDGRFRIFDAAHGTLEVVIDIPVVSGTAARSSTEAYNAVFSPDGARVLSHVGAEALLWSAGREPLLHTIDTSSDVLGGALAPDGLRIVAVGGQGLAEIRALDGALLTKLDAGRANLWDASWSGALIAAAGDEGWAGVFAERGGALVRLEGHVGTVNGVRLRPDGAVVATAGDDKTLRLWDPTTGAPRGSLPHPDRVTALAWSSDGRRLATAGYEGNLRVWDPIAQRLLVTIVHPTPFLSVSFSPNDDGLAASGRDGTVGVWDIATGARRLALEGHTGPVTTVTFSPDGGLLASTGVDARVRIWDAQTGLELGSREHRTEIMGGVWLHDGARFLSFGNGPWVRVWDAGRAPGTAADAAAFDEARVPWRLVGERVEYTRPTRPTP